MPCKVALSHNEKRYEQFHLISLMKLHFILQIGSCPDDFFSFLKFCLNCFVASETETTQPLNTSYLTDSTHKLLAPVRNMEMK